MDTSLTPVSPAGYHDFAGMARLRAEAGRVRPTGSATESLVARHAAQQFEAHFIQQMMKSMREAVERSDLLESGHADMFQELMDKELAVKMAQGGTLGMASWMERQLSPQAPAIPTVDELPPSTAAVLAARARSSVLKVAGHE